MSFTLYGNLRLCTLLFFLYLSPRAALNETYLSLQGYSGIINTPNAMILPDGHLTLQFSNQLPPSLADKYPDVFFNNYIFTLGFFPNIEITGRFMNSLSYPSSGPRDLSADIKCGYSFSSIRTWLPSIACGIQDISGGAAHLQSKYLVISEDIKNLRISLGYGTGPDRMLGVFFGTELFITSYFHLLFDNDGKQAAVAARFATPYDFERLPFSTAFTIKNIYRDKTPGFTFSGAATFDLKNCTNKKSDMVCGKNSEPPGSPADLPEKVTTAFTPISLTNRLAAYGFENVSVDTEKNIVYINYENHRFAHNEMDALGIVLGTAAMTVDSSIDTIQVTVLRSQTPVLTIKVERMDYLRFLHFKDMNTNITVENQSIVFRRESSEKPINRTRGKIRCELSPRLRYFLGTEVGAFDYQLSANADAFISLWPGANCATRLVFPIWHTINFENKKPFSSYREKTHLNSASLFQFLHFGNGITTLFSTGLHNKKYLSFMNDLRFTSTTGFFTTGIEGGYFYSGDDNRKTGLLYTEFQLPSDLFMKITGGIFWEQDTGIDITITRRFLDIDFGFFSKFTKNRSNNYDIFVGAQICIPLTSQRGMKPRFISISGKDNWRTSIATRFVRERDHELNTISTACGVIPFRLISLNADYFNRNRLDERYIHKNMALLRNAWWRYCSNE